MQIRESIGAIGSEQPGAEHGRDGLSIGKAGDIGELQFAFRDVRLRGSDDGFAAGQNQGGKSSACCPEPCLPRRRSGSLGIAMLDPQNVDCSLEELALRLRQAFPFSDTGDQCESLRIAEQSIEPARAEMPRHGSGSLGSERAAEEGDRVIIIERLEVQFERFFIILLAYGLEPGGASPVRHPARQHEAGVAELAEFPKHKIDRLAFLLCAHLVERIDYQNLRIAK